MTVAMHRLKEELIGNPCHAPIAADYGSWTRPQFWEEGPNIESRAGPKTRKSELDRHRLERWKRVATGGPGIGELKRRHNCR